MDPDDLTLIDRVKRGDQAAFRPLVERYQRRVFALALSVMRDADEARDVVQEAFVKAYRHLDSFQGDASFYTWLYRIAMNQCIDRMRRMRRGEHVEFDEAIDREEVGESGISPQRLGFDPAQALVDREIRERVGAALEKLSPPHRAVLVLREVEGLSYQEIADVLGCAIGTVMSRLFHARKRMQEMLRPLVDGEPLALAEAAAGMSEKKVTR